ncbi:MAG: serine/threonine-protein kinase [Gemmatimonadaceae bacterium]|nr:serine/threonine-protein kinase [Gemmatimonadaceae bacterium]
MSYAATAGGIDLPDPVVTHDGWWWTRATYPARLTCPPRMLKATPGTPTPRAAPAMDSTRWPEIERVLDRALDVEPSAWPALLDAECSGDPALRQAVERLLARHGHAPTLLDAGAGAVAAALVRDLHDDAGPDDPLVGEVLGAWRVVREIGRGGMSRVYLAERNDGAFAQRAAIKVLRAGLDTAADIERFHGERRILATLEHPFIARLLDGGVTPDGRPYLVLEYIDGVPLTEWSTSQRLDVPARLRLMLSVAEATQAAHRQLVVHRDLKPSNVLVDTHGRPRLLDFGIAKILEPGATADTVTRQRWLSPAYAAPEQFDGRMITTATDVFQLGAILYELLSGQRPFGDDAVARRSAALDDPPPPSRMNAALRGDLDAIVARAMRSDPDARYATVADFAADLRRVLDGEPVLARAGDRAYRWRRAIRRRALPLSLGAAAFAIATIYAITVTVQNRRIARALETATTEREKAEQVTRFVLGLFEASDPRGGRSDTITARTLLARGAARADGLASQPEVQAELLDVVGRINATLGASATARTAIERALAIRRRLLGEMHADVARSRLALSSVANQEGKLAEAEAEARAALRTALAVTGDTSLLVHDARFQLARVLHERGQPQVADSVFAQWEQALVRTPRTPSEALAAQLFSYGGFVLAREQFAKRGTRGEAIVREALAMQRTLLGPSHVDVAITEQRLGEHLAATERTAEADTLLRHALGVLEAAFPDGHFAVANARQSYGMLLVRVGRPNEGFAEFRAAVEMIDRVMGDRNPMSPVFRSAFASALVDAERYVEAEPELRTSAAQFAALGADGAVMHLAVRLRLGDLLRRTRRLDEAERELTATVSALSASRGDANRMTQRGLRMLAELYDAQRRVQDAARIRARLLADTSARRGADSTTRVRVPLLPERPASAVPP